MDEGDTKALTMDNESNQQPKSQQSVDEKMEICNLIIKELFFESRKVFHVAQFYVQSMNQKQSVIEKENEVKPFFPLEFTIGIEPFQIGEYLQKRSIEITPRFPSSM